VSDEWRFSSDSPNQNAKRRVAALAGRQFGRIRWDQLRAAGVSKAVISAWVTDGYLHPRLPRVYAVGHAAASLEANLSAATLYAGPGAMLCHDMGIWWWGLLNYPPDVIHVSTPRRCKSLPGIKVHGRRNVERTWRKGLPVTTVHQTLEDYALSAPKERLRFVLATADYHGLLNVPLLDNLHGPGAAALHAALKIHRPELAHARSDFERLLVPLCEANDIPIPKFDVYRHGWLVDAVWDDRKVVVELDSLRAHRTRAQLERDHQRDLELRATGYTVLRYTWYQLTDTAELVARDLKRHL
jgi:very-short-patch-repair endonuclease